jgi:choline transporter-like protein 2/4/5
MTTCVWYFSATALDTDKLESNVEEVRAEGKNKTVPLGTVLRSFIVALRYHLGTILFGALCIAIIQFIRAVFLYIQEEFLDKYKENATVKFIIYCINCWLACIERVIKIISKNAYIITAIKGTNFCSSAAEAMAILTANCLRVGALATMSTIASFVLKLFITASNTILGFGILQQEVLYYRSGGETIESGLFPLVGIFLISFIIASLFISVYESCTDTVMMCFFIDSDELEGAFLPRSLGELVGQFETAEKARKEYEAALRAATSKGTQKVQVKEATSS